MNTRIKSLILPVAVFLAAVPATAQFEDAMWFAARQGRTLTKVSASGEVLQTVDMSSNGFNLGRVCRAPNGDLWVINFITSTLTITDRNGGNIVNIDTSAIGARGATDIAFDRAGIAWVTFNGASLVARMLPNGTVLGTVSVPGAPLGITIDTGGNVWVAHRQTAPSQVTKIDSQTLASNQYSLPFASSTLGGQVLADSRGPIGASHIWVSGDGSNELHELDNNGTHLQTYNLGPNGTAGIGSLTLDGDGNIWAAIGRLGGSRGEVYRVNRTTGAVLTTLNDGPEPLSVCTDSFGRAWYINRLSFSGPTPSEIRRADLAPLGLYEVAAPIGNGAYQMTDPNGFHRAFVIDPLGDFDGDGVQNYAEVLSGTSPYDAQSNTIVSLLTRGNTAINNTPIIDVTGATSAPCTVAFAFGSRVAISIPGFIGQLRLDPTQILPITVGFALPGQVSLPIPNNPTLIGAILRTQAIVIAGAGVQFSNDAAIVIQ